jgi:hypothetical protein
MVGEDDHRDVELPRISVLTEEERARGIIEYIPEIIARSKKEHPDKDYVAVMNLYDHECGQIYRDHTFLMDEKGLKGAAKIVYDYCDAAGLKPSVHTEGWGWDETGFKLFVRVN